MIQYGSYWRGREWQSDTFVINDMYDGNETTIISPAGEKSEFPIILGSQCGQLCDLFIVKFYLALVMDELTRSILDEAPWYMLFADDII